MTQEKVTWRVGDLARETGLTVRALHHYDRLGLLSPSSRTEGGHRCYTSADLRRLHHLIALRSFGLSLKEIKGVLDADAGRDPAALLATTSPCSTSASAVLNALARSASHPRRSSCD
jgi:MerR family transcriptional regulator, thiopeptide resistance regulator